MACAHTCSLKIAAHIKIIGKPSFVFTNLWSGIYLRLSSKKYKIVSWKKKEFEDTEDLLVSFRLYFKIVKDSNSSCSSTI
jgi:hypothetical protein